jgi:hypothetical protein
VIDPFIGTWELDPDTLKYESGRPGKRATYVIEAVANGLLFLLDGEDDEGKPIKFQYSGPMDGSGQLLPGDGGLVLVLKRDSDLIIESVLNRGEMVLDRWTRELSPDGQRIKMTQYVPNPNGQELQNTSIYRRVTTDRTDLSEA